MMLELVGKGDKELFTGSMLLFFNVVIINCFYIFGQKLIRCYILVAGFFQLWNVCLEYTVSSQFDFLFQSIYYYTLCCQVYIVRTSPM